MGVSWIEPYLVENRGATPVIYGIVGNFVKFLVIKITH